MMHGPAGGSGGGGGHGLGGTRVPTWRERENNRRRERRRRAIAAKIYTGLRAYGNYNLPKHCDNNEVLKALCNEAGWVVEPDGTTYRRGCKPPPQARTDPMRSASASPCSSYQPSPRASYNPSPASSSFPSSGSSSHITLGGGNNFIGGVEGSSLIPWLKNLSSNPSFASSSKLPQLHHLYFNGGSISAPVTPPSSSPTHTPRMKTDWESQCVLPPWAGANYASLPNSTPPSPGHHVAPDPAWLAGFQISSAGPSSPTYNLVSHNPFGIALASSSRVCTPGQSGTCSPAMGDHAPAHHDVQMEMVEGAADDFAFGSNSNGNNGSPGLVKAWEGERIHEECASDELELTLGSSRTRGEPPF
ncbi:hypothetical protein CFC21_110156 [Triticum aestivum]|uniref:Protein BZR1 homolog n=4 Tax=Triticinae TaxID=1648030 RepID=A0A453SEL9_AEGTS|nr:protein BZR1 homolog 3 [Aegilops tauschii subsp. strangulata]XP_044440904.1 protein BZR1 homolog 3-like [Triticum aestivum]KAF7109987.1 hypothetical protein CFC21_110156 [Triticum aestivum]